MKLRSMAPQWFHDDSNKIAKCVLFPASVAYDPWFGDLEDPEALDDTEAVDDTEEAKKICNGTDDKRPCPLLELCLEFAMTNNERYGVWGGMSADERALLRKERKLCQQSEAVGLQNSQDD